jgi:hypothetical protein
MFISAVSLIARRVVVVAAATVLASAGLIGAAIADPGIDNIGPGPSNNTAGVKCIQQALNRAISAGQLTGLADVSTLEVDGKYGDAVYRDVKRFQQAKGVSVDGAVGPATGDKLLSYAPEGQDCLKNIPTTVSSADSVATPNPGQNLDAGAVQPTGPDATYNCSFSCSLYLSRSATKAAYEKSHIVEGGIGAQAVAVCAAVGAASGGTLAVPCVAAAAVEGAWIIQEIEDAATRHGTRGACFKVTVSPVSLYFSTNNGTYCKD